MTLPFATPLRALLALTLCSMLPPSSALADRIHLEGGGSIDIASWWIEDDLLMYDSGEGTVGIPRSSVVRIDRGEATSPSSSRSGWNAPERRGGTVPDATSEELDIERTRALLERGKQALERRDFRNASSYFLSVINASPTNNAARVGYAVSEIAQGRDGLALSVVLDGLARDPARPELLELLGDLRNREERVEDALESWREAFDLASNDRLREKILKAERELHASRDYDFAASSHFNLRYDGDVDLALAAAMMDYLEEQYWILSDRYRHSPPQPITVQLYPQREFREVTRAPEWVGGLYDGKIRVPLGGLNRLDPRARGVLRHELAHAVIHSKTRGNCPRWLHEGLAQIAEEKPLLRADRIKIAERLSSGDPAAWENAGFSYPMALDLTRHVESFQGFDGLVQLLGQLGEGRELDAAFRFVYGRDHAQICDSWARAALDAQP